MGLEDCMDFLRVQLAAVIDGVKGVCKGFLAVGTIETLAPFAGLGVFVGLRVTSEGTGA